MRFSILIPETREIPATEVAAIAEVIRKRFELDEGAPVGVENILMEAAERALIELPEKFSVDTSEEVEVTAEELSEAIEDEA